MKFPAEESHYSKERSKRKYLGTHLNLSKTYNLYKSECEENNLSENIIAKEWLYCEIFNTEFNLSFKPPDNDTCDKCDFFLVSLRDSQTAEGKNAINTEYEEHLSEASKRYNLKKKDKENALQNAVTQIMICVDLICLPTPVLTNSPWLLLNHNMKKYLFVDASHSLIEREKKKTMGFQIITPWDWQQLARMCSAKNSFQVENLEIEDFKDFKLLYGESGEAFAISQIVHLQVRSDDKGLLYYKTDFDCPEFQKVNLKRTERRIIFPEELTPIRCGLNPISTKKHAPPKIASLDTKTIS
ncbi:hypothetical protein RN001_004287 [Aquatica leii]|uniref:Uncharacterized protein n=1 Tax=Aquatica leii TaxID=1421715 RepID=A0AAN7QJG1_9COLE|nr:hypothetical protein RN001_004287 [Aquatica leii]